MTRVSGSVGSRGEAEGEVVSGKAGGSVVVRLSGSDLVMCCTLVLDPDFRPERQSFNRRLLSAEGLVADIRRPTTPTPSDTKRSLPSHPPGVYAVPQRLRRGEAVTLSSQSSLSSVSIVQANSFHDVISVYELL